MLNLHRIKNGLFPEWYPQSSILIAWPDESTDFAPVLNEVEKTYLEIVQAIGARQKVIIAVRNKKLHIHVQQLISTLDTDQQQIIYLEIAYDDIWVRDIAPIAIQHKHTSHLLNFRFNAWGKKYACPNDAQFAQQFIASQVLPASKRTCNLVFEGGAFDSNGSGQVLTTASCLYDPKRNSENRDAIHKQALDALDANQLLILENGALIGDDTGGHIDTLARFCSEKIIVFTSCEDSNDLNYSTLKKLYYELRQLKTVENKPFQLLPLPLPSPIFNNDKQQLPANYANFLIINNAVLVPQYDDKQDELAIITLKQCFPDRNIIPINCLSLIQQFGSLHCMTMNYPQTLQP